MSGFLDFISNIIPITGNSTVDTILFALINIAAFGVAWYITGLIAELIGLERNGMSLIHWVVRIAVYLGLICLLCLIVKLIRWFFSFEWWVYLIIGIVFLHIIGGIIALCLILKKKKKTKEQNTND